MGWRLQCFTLSEAQTCHPLNPRGKTTWFNQGAPAAEWTHAVLSGVFLWHSCSDEDRVAASEETYHEPAVPPASGIWKQPNITDLSTCSCCPSERVSSSQTWVGTRCPAVFSQGSFSRSMDTTLGVARYDSSGPSVTFGPTTELSQTVISEETWGQDG